VLGWDRRWVEQKDGRRRLPGVSGVREFGSLTRVDLAFVCPCMSLELGCFERDIIGRGPTSGGPTAKYLINLLLVFGQGLRGNGDWLYLLWLGYRKRGVHRRCLVRLAVIGMVFRLFLGNMGG
jgi:hypothetical protein